MRTSNTFMFSVRILLESLLLSHFLLSLYAAKFQLISQNGDVSIIHLNGKKTYHMEFHFVKVMENDFLKNYFVTLQNAIFKFSVFIFERKKSSFVSAQRMT